MQWTWRMSRLFLEDIDILSATDQAEGPPDHLILDDDNGEH